MKKIDVIITAGGTGKRFGADLPKQFLDLCGKPVIQYSIEEMLRLQNLGRLIITLPAKYIDYFNTTILPNINAKHDILTVEGGGERFDSIRKNLCHTSSDADFIIVHDSVRPFFTAAAVENAVSTMKHDGIIFASLSKNTLKTVKNNIVTETLDRSAIYNIQTPQIFRASALRESYKTLPSFEGITDDASVVERCGGKVEIYPYHDLNLKITTKNDFLIAESIITNQIQY